MSKAPYDAMIAYISLHDRSHHKSPCFKSRLWIKQSWEKCLIPDSSPDCFKKILRLGTRRIQAFSFCFVLIIRPTGVITCCTVDVFAPVPPPLLQCWLIDPQKLLPPVTDIGSVEAVRMSLTPTSCFPPYLSIDGSDWRFWFFFFLWLRWGSWKNEDFFLFVFCLF